MTPLGTARVPEHFPISSPTVPLSPVISRSLEEEESLGEADKLILELLEESGLTDGFSQVSKVSVLTM